MAYAIDPDVYLDLLSADYLDEYIPTGGSTVKVVVGDAPTRNGFIESLEERAKLKGFIYVRINASDTRLHKLEELFYAIARQINWIASARRFLTTVLFPRFDLNADDLSIDAIAKYNGQERWSVDKGINQILHTRLIKRGGFSGEFRRAMFSLVGSVLSPGSLVSRTTPFVVQWLEGSLKSITQVREAMLYRRINRTNGRQILTSLTRWLQDGGASGLVLVIDLTAVTIRMPSSLGGIRYTRSSAIDCFEMIRQFFDSIDAIQGLALWFVADHTFADDEKLGVHAYPALEMRLAEDIHDSTKPNPFAPMVRLAHA